MKIGFTGSRNGMTGQQATQFMQVVLGLARPISEFHHGDCVGADDTAHDLIRLNVGCKIVIHPPTRSVLRAWRKGDMFREEKNYIPRNCNIVDETDMLIATPNTDQEIMRSGTWQTVRYAKRQGKRTVIIYPDGSIEEQANGQPTA